MGRGDVSSMGEIWIFSVAVALIGSLGLLWSLGKRGRKGQLPPSPWPALPIIGHLHLLKLPIHRTFQRLCADLRSPIVSLRLGNRRLVVVSSPELVEECFHKNDVVLATRPYLLIAKYISYEQTTLVAAPYGDHWRNLRRLTNTDVFSPARLAVFQSMREEETRFLVDKISRKVGGGGQFGKVVLRPLLSQLTFNNMMRMVAGKRYLGNETEEEGEEALKFQRLIEKTFAVGGVGNPADFIPILKWIDFSGFEKTLKRLSEDWDVFLQFLIDEKRKSSKEEGGNGSTMIDHLISLQQSDSAYYTDTIIKGIILVMLVAGTDTSAVTIEWAMTALLNNPEKMELARQEIDDVVGVDRLIKESDISKLPYLNDIILETFRLFPAAPLLVPHEASSDCEIGGYHIPQGTIVIANAWAIHRDPSIWEDATAFNPERFQTGGEIGVGKLLPFGIGRRSCPGNLLATKVVSLVLGSLIQRFEWRRLGEELVDTKEGGGTSMPKSVPLEALCRTRPNLH